MLKAYLQVALQCTSLPDASFDYNLIQNLKYSSPENVVELSLGNKMDETMINLILTGNMLWVSLNKLDVSNNKISDKLAAEIGKNSTWD